MGLAIRALQPNDLELFDVSSELRLVLEWYFKESHDHDFVDAHVLDPMICNQELAIRTEQHFFFVLVVRPPVFLR